LVPLSSPQYFRPPNVCCAIWASNIFPLISSISGLCARPPAAAAQQSSVAQAISSIAWRNDPKVAVLDPHLLRICYQFRRPSPTAKQNVVQQLLSISCCIRASPGRVSPIAGLSSLCCLLPAQSI